MATLGRFFCTVVDMTCECIWSWRNRSATRLLLLIIAVVDYCCCCYPSITHSRSISVCIARVTSLPMVLTRKD